MTMASGSTGSMNRMNDQGYKNWLKVGQALLQLRDGMSTFMEQQSRVLHANLKQDVYGNDPLHSCASCKCKNIKCNYATKTWELKKHGSNNRWIPVSCPDNVCQKWINAIHSRHKQKTNVYWENGECQEWPGNHWSVMKIFMAAGQKDSTGPQDCDSAALVSALSNCNFFDQKLYKAPADKVLQVRNATMHSKTLQVSDTVMRQGIDTIITLLKTGELGQTQEAKDAVTNIIKIRDDLDFSIILSEEVVIWEDQLKDLTASVQVLDKVLTPEVEKFLEFVKSNPDLHKELERQVAELDGKVKKLSSDVCHVKREQEQMRHEMQSFTRQVTTKNQSMDESIRSVQGTVDETEKKQQQLQAQTARNTSRIDALDAKTGNLCGIVSDQSSKIKDTQAAACSNAGNIRNLQSDVIATREELQQLRVTTETAVSNQQSKAQANALEIQNLRASTLVNAADISEVKSQQNDLASNVETLYERVGSGSVVDNTKQIQELQQRQISSETKQQQTSEQIHTLTQQQAAMQNQISAIPPAQPGTVYNIQGPVQIGSNNRMVFHGQGDGEDQIPAARATAAATSPSHIRITDSSQEVDHKEIGRLANKIWKKWKQLGRNLGLEPVEIEQIDYDYDRDGLYEKSYQVLHLWLSKFGSNATLTRLAHALKDSGLTELAESVQPRH